MRLLCKKRFILNTHMHTVNTKFPHTWTSFLTYGNVLPRVIVNNLIYIQIPIRTSQMPNVSEFHHNTHVALPQPHTHTRLIMQCGMVVIKLNAKLMKTELENFPFDEIWTRSPQSNTQNITKLYSLRGISFHSCSSSCYHAGRRCHTFPFLK